MQLCNELRSLLGEDIEQPPELTILNTFGSGPKSVLAFPACLDQVVEYGDHFIVVHKSTF
jgi:hypothetical protein